MDRYRQQKLWAAITDLARHGCDLADPAMTVGTLADDGAFHLGYLEEVCGFRPTVGEVVHVAHLMAADLRRHAAADIGSHRLPAEHVGSGRGPTAPERRAPADAPQPGLAVRTDRQTDGRTESPR